MERSEAAFSYAGALYQKQDDLRLVDLIDLGAAHGAPRDALESCMDSAETHRWLREDIEWAKALGIRGTPLVLINGRPVEPDPLFIYAIILAGGDSNHRAFRTLR